MSLSCYGLYGHTAECQFCGDKLCCQAATKRKVKRWEYAVSRPKVEVSKSEHEVALNEAGMKRWIERDKLKTRLEETM